MKEKKNTQILYGKFSRERKSIAAVKTVFINTQDLVTYIIILEIMYISINKLINLKPYSGPSVKEFQCNLFSQK
jgi:hypothetical protein